jgi:DNA repair protein RecN (Recombination protein N)
MLAHLSIRNLALAEHLELDFSPQMIAISGETGAGKSILLDALGLALGGRSSADTVRHGAKRADVSAVFNIEALPHASAWLANNELDDGSECILRRTLSAEGRSRAFINGQPVTLPQLRELGQTLIDIHGQHEHQSLLRKEIHGQLVDDCGQLQCLADEVRDIYQQWNKKRVKLESLRARQHEHESQVQLLTYQVDELNALELGEGELTTLENEQQQLANAESILQSLATLHDQYLEGENASIDLLGSAITLINHCEISQSKTQAIRQLLEEARISLQEAARETVKLQDKIEQNPERLTLVDERLAVIYDLARKHRVSPEQLPQRHVELQAELTRLTIGENSLEQLEEQVNTLRENYESKANSLSEKRKAAAVFLQEAVKQQLKRLGMSPELEFDCRRVNAPTANGLDDIEILISMNPGQPLKPLQKVASGGELSRISLCIQVVTATTSQTPTLVFDEVDVGIGGPTAEIVGRMLRQLGDKAQILCVSHLAQVVSQAHDHLLVTKTVEGGKTCSAVRRLAKEERVREVARMLGGVDISQQGLALASEMLSFGSLQ